MKRLCAVPAVAVSLCFSSVAAAQVLGSSGDAVFGAERLFGIRGETAEFERGAPAVDGEVRSTTMSFGVANPLLAQNIPRLAFDYLVANKFSLGGTIGYSSSDTEVEGLIGPTRLGGETTTFLFGARAGFLHMFGRVLGIWARGGVVHHSTSFEGSNDLSDFGLSLECQFPIVIAPHFGLMPGLVFDQSLTGTVDPAAPNAGDYDFEYRSIAVQLALFGWI